MFSEVFLFLLDCFSQIINLLRNTIIDSKFNFSYFDFLVCCTAVIILLELLKSIRKESAEEDRWLNNKFRNEEYNAYQRKLRSYEKERNSDK